MDRRRPMIFLETAAEGLLPWVQTVQNLYDFEITTIDRNKQNLQIYRGGVLLIVNVASQCRFTAQYAGLEEMYRK
jgi:glutathione peroxidase-family protein